jgi:hypothetical protein
MGLSRMTPHEANAKYEGFPRTGVKPNARGHACVSRSNGLPTALADLATIRGNILVQP